VISKDTLDVPEKIRDLGIWFVEIGKDGIKYLSYKPGFSLKLYPQILELFDLYPDGCLRLSLEDYNVPKLEFDCKNPKVWIYLTFYDEQELSYKILEFKKFVEECVELRDYFNLLVPTISEVRFIHRDKPKVNTREIKIHFLIGIMLEALVQTERSVYVGGVELRDWGNPEDRRIRLLRGVSRYRRKQLALLDRVESEIDVYDSSILEKIRNFADANKEIIRDLLKKRVVENV